MRDGDRLKKNRRSASSSVARSAWPAFLTAHAVLVSEVERRLKEAELPELAWYDVLWALERAPKRRLRMHELADAVVVSRSNLTRLADRLESNGLVSRERCDDDRRSSFAVLTDAGSEMRKRMWPVYRAAIEELFDDHLSADEQASLRAVLQRLLEAAAKAAAPQ
jgi:DNA-binding MarR family transcriptional regulator